MNWDKLTDRAPDIVSSLVILAGGVAIIWHLSDAKTAIFYATGGVMGYVFAYMDFGRSRE